MLKINQKLKKAYKKTKRKSLIVYLILRMLVVLCMILQILKREYFNALLCVLSLVLFTLPFFIKKKFKIELPNTLEIIILCFIFSAEILGEINNFYGLFPHWDTILHTLNGFLCAGIGFALIDLLNKNVTTFNLSPIYVALVAFCFSMTVGVIWEFFEFGADRIFKMDTQKDRIVQTISTISLNDKNKPVIIKNIYKTVLYDKDNQILATIDNGYLDIGIIDTIKDLIVNFIGAITFSIFGLLYISNRDKYSFAKNFIPTKKSS